MVPWSLEWDERVNTAMAEAQVERVRDCMRRDRSAVQIGGMGDGDRSKPGNGA
jgi:hypothetical protein